MGRIRQAPALQSDALKLENESLSHKSEHFSKAVSALSRGMSEARHRSQRAICTDHGSYGPKPHCFSRPDVWGDVVFQVRVLTVQAPSMGTHLLLLKKKFWVWGSLPFVSAFPICFNVVFPPPHFPDAKESFHKFLVSLFVY